MGKSIITLAIYFDTPIEQHEVGFFRGAVLKSLGKKADVLYHNHTGEDKFRYAYPLIQYKRLRGKAAIVCVEDGVGLVGQILSELSGTLSIGQREAFCQIAEVKASNTPVEIVESVVTYQLSHWLPLSARNYALYQNTDELVERLKILERILTGNILSFLKGVDIHVDEQLQIGITEITKQQVVSYKQVKLLSFDIKFKANISLPPYIGIGKNASVGCGVIRKINN